MTIITSLYSKLFGKEKIRDGDVISMSEHGRVGGLSTGQPFKFVSFINPNTGTDVQMSEMIIMLRSILTAIANPSYVDKSANQMRAQVTGTVTATVSSTSIVNFGTFPADHLQRMDNMTAWSTNIRSLIT